MTFDPFAYVPSPEQCKSAADALAQQFMSGDGIDLGAETGQDFVN